MHGSPLPAAAPAALGSAHLRRRLRELAGEERAIQVQFLAHLDEFDRRRAFAEAGFDSLWTYCLRELHLREGAAARRIAAMRALRRFPELAEPLQDGRLCLSTIAALAPVLQPDNVSDLVSRAAYKTKLEVERLVAIVQPRSAPKDGIRRMAQPEAPGTSAGASAFLSGNAVAGAAFGRAGAPFLGVGAALGGSGATLDGAGATFGGPAAGSAAAGAAMGNAGSRETVEEWASSVPESSDSSSDSPGGLFAPRALPAVTGSPVSPACVGAPSEPDAARAPLDEPRGPRAESCAVIELRPVAEDRWSMRVTLDDATKADLDALAALLSHKPGRDLATVLKEAIRCGLEKHGKRRGAVAPTRQRSAAGQRSAAPAEMRSARVREGATGPRAGKAVAPSVSPSAHDASTGAASVSPSAHVASTAPALHRDRAVPAAVRREVWQRDEGRCSWIGPDGRRCGSQWQLELDHVRPVALGGESTTGNLRVVCRTHNMLHAERVFGREHMDRFRRKRGSARERRDATASGAGGPPADGAIRPSADDGDGAPASTRLHLDAGVLRERAPHCSDGTCAPARETRTSMAP